MPDPEKQFYNFFRGHEGSAFHLTGGRQIEVGHTERTIENDLVDFCCDHPEAVDVCVVLEDGTNILIRKQGAKQI